MNIFKEGMRRICYRAETKWYYHQIQCMDLKYHFELTTCKKTFLRQSRNIEYSFILDDIKELLIFVKCYDRYFFMKSFLEIPTDMYEWNDVWDCFKISSTNKMGLIDKISILWIIEAEWYVYGDSLYYSRCFCVCLKFSIVKLC